MKPILNMFQLKRLLALLLALALLPALALADTEEEDPLSLFAIRHGRRDEKKIAITVDDSFDLKWTWEIRELFHELGIVGTFFPIGKQIHVEDGEEWRKIIDYGNEIGSHNNGHYKMGPSPAWTTITALGRFQENLDKALGYHYQVQAFRPPEGNMTDKNGSTKTFRTAVTKFGYQHVVLWDVSQTDPDKAYYKVQNGSILLYHARHKDYECMKTLIPRLLEDGYEFVTISELLGFGEIQTGTELYVFRKSDYQQKK